MKLKLKVKLKSFEELVSISVPVLDKYNGKTPEIALKNLAYKNFNTPEGKYLYIPSILGELHNKEFIVEDGHYEDCWVYDNAEERIKLGLWMFNIIEKIKD